MEVGALGRSGASANPGFPSRVVGLLTTTAQELPRAQLHCSQRALFIGDSWSLRFKLRSASPCVRGRVSAGAGEAHGPKREGGATTAWVPCGFTP